MAIKLADTLAPMADFPAALAEHIEFSDGKSLQEKYDLGELGGEGGGGHIELTQAEYDALSEEEKLNGAIYFITDAEGGGADGKSAYEIWLEAGNTGTEEDFLISLVGEKGADGKSAYQYAQDGGYIGTETEFTTNIARSGVISKELEVERARIDNLTTLQDGSTTGDAELIDARIDKDGNTHVNVGEHIRTVSSQLSSEIVGVKSDLSESYSELKETIESALNGYKNFTDYNWIDTYTLTSTDGSLVSNENTYYMSATDYIPVNKGETISITGIGTIYRIWQYNLDKTVIANSMVATATESYEYTATKNVYIRFVIIRDSDIEGYTSKDLIKTVIYAPVKDKFFLSWKNKTFVSLGDSITWQDGNAYTQGNVGVIARGYQTILKENLGFASYDNKGISGRPIANGTANGDGTVTTAQSVNYANFDLCIIAGGTNDFKLNVPIGKIGVIGDTVFDDTTFYGAYRKMLEHILTQKPTIRICLFTPLQRDNGGYDVNHTNTAGHKLIDYANAVKAVGEMYGIPVCDMYANSGFTKLTLATYTLDGLHPNDLGYERMGGYAAQFINAISN